MSAFYCDFCGEPRTQDRCEECGNPTRALDASVELAEPTTTHERIAFEPPKAEPHRLPTAPIASAPRAEDAVHRNLAQLEHYISSGYELYLIAGIENAGKTELLRAYPQVGLADRVASSATGVQRTAPGEFKCYTMTVGVRKVAFVDASGEYFRLLYPFEKTEHGLRERPVSPQQFRAFHLMAKHLRGVLLVLDLRKLWGAERNHRGALQQPETLAWILSVVRWARHADDEAFAAMTDYRHIDDAVRHMRYQLEIPVQIIFSKADLLEHDQVGIPAIGTLPGTNSDARKLDPRRAVPLRLAYHALAPLFDAATQAARYVRFDFARAVETDPDSGVIVNTRAYGVDLALGWLFDDDSRRFGLSTRQLVAIETMLDRLTLKGDLWTRTA
jgi:hypothetical protein